MAPDNPYWNLNLGPALVAAVLGGLLPFFLSWGATLRARRARVRWGLRGLAFVVFLGCNPLANWVAFEPLNKQRLAGMGDRVRAVRIEGMGPEAVRALLGEPSFVWPQTATYSSETWNYQPTPFYLAGSKLQVHFRGGVVAGWENYDD
ncbi:hypothetical protein ACLESO_31450 [Pyxidicoccus sp. 3LG]